MNIREIDPAGFAEITADRLTDYHRPIRGSNFTVDVSKMQTDEYVVVWNSETGNLHKFKVCTYYGYGG